MASAHRTGPAEGIGLRAPLDAGQLVVELLRQLADTVMVDLIAFVAPAECADGGDDGGGADAPRLLERTGLGGLEQLVHAQQPLLDGNVPALQKLDGGFARDAAQDGAGQRGSDDGAVDLEHDVHAAALLDVLTLHAVEPQHLRVALGLGALAGAVGRAVVAAALDMA